jgi:hypothetical protein
MKSLIFLIKIPAESATEFSYESVTIENGFFTEGLLYSLNNEPVNNETGGLQNPSIDRDNSEMDIRLPVLP